MSPVEFFFLKRAGRGHHVKSRRKRKAPTRHRSVVFETLEPRILLDAAPLMVDMAALGHNLTVQQSGADIQVVTTGTSTVVASQAAADTSQIVVTGQNAVADSLTINYSTPFFIDVSFAGGTGGPDSLTIQNGSFDSVTYGVTGSNAGTVGISQGASSATITYSGLEPVTDLSSAADRVFNGTASDDEIRLRDDDGLVAGRSTIDDNGTGAFESITFANPTGSLTVNALDGEDAIIINALDAGFDADLTVNAGDGSDDITVNAMTGSGTYTINGQGAVADTDTIRATRNADMTLTNAQLTVGSDVFALNGIEQAVLTGGGSDNTFTVSGWTGSGTLAGAGGSDTVAATKNANFTLTNASLATTDGMNLALSSIEAANLTGGGSGNTFTITGWTGTGTLDGAGGSDTVTLSKDANFTLTNTSLSATSGPSMTLSSIEVANLTGGGSGNTFTVGPWSGTANVNGQGGDDRYVLNNNWGTVAITEAASGGIDTLDFTAVTTDLQINAGRTIITTAGGSLTQGAELAEKIDVTLLASVKAKIIDLFGDFSDILEQAQGGADTVSELVNALPFLGELTGGSVPNLAEILSLTQTFQDLEAAVQSALSGLGATPTLSQVVTALNGITKPSLFTGGGNHLTFSTDYRKKAGAATDRLEALIDIDMHGSASQTVELETGPKAKGFGIDIDSTISVSATLSGILTVGFDTFSATADDVFLVPDNTLRLDVTASAAIASAPLNLGILALTISSGSVNVHSHVDLTLTDDPGDTDERITPSNIASGPLSDTVDITTGDTITPTASITVSVDPGVKVGGSDDLSGHTVTATVTFSDGVFGSGSGPSVPEFNFTIPDLPGVSLNDFGHVSLNDLLGMLGQVLNAFSGIGENAVLTTAIPFTGKTLGDVVDLASGFKRSVLDPLFKSGDILNPDFNGDSVVDLSDLAFSSIQSLAVALTAELGLGNLLDVDYDDSTKELTFAMNYHQAVGDASVVETTQGNATTNEVQTLTVNAVDSGGVLDDTFRLAFPTGVTVETTTPGDGSHNEVQKVHVHGATAGTYTLSFNGNATANIAFGATAAALKTALEAVSGITAVNVTISTSADERVYAIEFTNPGTTDVSQLVANTSNLTAHGVPQFTSPIALGASAATVKTALAGLSGIGSTSNVDVTKSLTDEIYTITFKGALQHMNVPLLIVNADELARGIPLDFGASLGDIANVQTDGDIILSAGFDTGFVFGVNLNQSTKIEITPPLFKPDNTAQVLVETATGGTSNLNEVQKIHVNNATSGTYTLWFDANNNSIKDGGEETAAIAFDAPATGVGSVESALEALVAIVNVDVSRLVSGNDRIYTVTFTNPGNQNVAQLVGDPTNLRGPDKNGILSANASFDAKLFYNPAATVITKQQGDATHNEQQFLMIASATGGDFTLGFSEAVVTGPLAYGAGAATVQTALEGLSGIGSGNVTVTKTGDTYTIDFHTGLTHMNVAQLIAGPSGLTNSAVAMTLSGITVNVDSTNTSLDDLRADVEAAINQKLIDTGNSLGFFTANLTPGATFTAGHTPMSTPLATDLAFTVAVKPAQVQIATTTQGDGTHNEVQTVTVTKAVGGTFTLTFGANTTSNIAYDATAATVQAALEALASIGGGNVAVTQSSGAYIVTFQGTKALTNVAPLTANSTALISTLVTIATTTPGDGTHNEVQAVTVPKNSTGGTFTLTFGANTTAALAYNASAATVQSALEGLASIGAGNVAVTLLEGVYTVTFQGAKALTNVAQLTANSTELLSAKVNGSVKKLAVTDAASLPVAIQAAINNALNQAGVTAITVTAGLDGSGKITLTPTGGKVNVQFRPALTVDAGGGRIAVEASPVTIAVDALTQSVNVDGHVQITAGFTNTAYQEMGLLSAPTRYTGTTVNTIDLTLLLNGADSAHVTLAAAARTSIEDLVSDLQSAVDTVLPGGYSAGDVEVFLIDPLGNRIGFRGMEGGPVTSLSMNVPDSATNGAITELGYVAGNGETHSSKADHFFLDNVHFNGNFDLAASGVTATASLGFLGITATGEGSLGDGKFIHADAEIFLKNPTGIGDADRVTVSEIVNSLKKGHFFFDNGDVGVDGDGNPTTGVVDATLEGGVGFHLDVEPTTPVGGIPGLDASLDLTLTSPNWFTARPSLADPLGFGTDEHALSTSPITLDTAVPGNGRLTDSVTFVLTDGTHYGTGFLPFGDTSAFTMQSQLTAALQTAMNAAIADFETDGGAAGKTVTVGISGGKVTLTASDATFGIRGPIAFSGPDLDAVLDKFRNLDFSDIIAGLRFVVDYLRSLDGSGGAGGAVAEALDFKLPLLDRSIADLVDVAGTFADKLNTIVNNPSGSIQELNHYIDGLLGLPLSTNVLSFDAGDEVLTIDYDILKSVHLTRPFNLDLADAGLPAVFTNLVSLSASGNLDLSASVEFNLDLGLDLSGETKSFFIKTGSSGTGLHADLTATGNNLTFDAQIGPFGLFVIGGSAGLNGHIDVTMVDDGDGRFDLVSLTGISPTVHLPSLSDVDVDFPTGGGMNAASVNLPLYLGTKDNPVPLDFLGSDPGQNNALSVNVNLVALLTPPHTGAFSFTLPEFDFTNLATNLPGIFALLSDPAVTVDGLDRLLGTIQDAVSGQIMGTKLPLIGDALANNPASQFIGNMRSDVLQPLAKTIRENNLNLDGLIGLIQATLFNVFGPSHLNILKDSSDPGSDITKDDVKFTFFESDGVTPTDILFLAHSVQLEMDLGKTFSVSTPPIDLDLGIDALGIHAQLQPKIILSFDLKLGFGVDDKKGFYFVTEPAQELSVTMYADLGSTDSTTSFDDADRAKLDARLLFLALKVADGVDLDGNGTITRGTDADGDGIPDDISEDEFSHIYFSAGVDLADPNDDGKLTIGEMVSGSFSDIVKPTLVGEAELHAQGKVDFSTLGPGLGNVLPSVTADLLVDFSLSATPSTGFHIAAPQVILANVTLDLGSFVSSFAGPILNQIHDILEPFDWLIGPDGFLNKRIPLLSDLAGHKITGKDLIQLFDPEDGPTVVAILDFVEQLSYLSGLVNDAASGGSGVGLNFGDLVLFDSPDIANPGGAFLDHLIDIGSGVSDLRTLNNFKNVLNNLPDPTTLASQMQTQGSPSSATSSFTSGVTQPGSIDFAILKPENIFKLILGQPDVTLVTVNLPKMGFNFLYRQQFPIIGPLVGTFAGGVGGGIDMGFGYDTRGLSEFLTTHSPVDLLDGFFLTDLDANGVDKPEAFLTAQIAVGAAISLGIASAGVEGGIQATIDFNFADLDNDGKIRILELGALLEANSFNPLAVFDVSGEIDLFMRAYVEFLFFKAEFEFLRLTLFEFEVNPIKPPLLGSLNGDTLTLNVGPNAAARLNGNTSDANENIVLTMDGSDVVVSSFTVNGADQHPVDIKGFGRFAGVHNIVIDGGSGNDTLDLTGISSSIAITMHGGVGNDVLKGGGGADTIFGDAGNDEIHGGGGIDTISGGDDNDTIYGDAGNDILMGDAGNDFVYGGANNDTLAGGPGDDHLFGEGGSNTYLTADFGSIETIDASGGSDTLDFSTKPQGLTFFLDDTGLPAGLKIKVGMTQTTTPTVGTDPLDPLGPHVPSDPTFADFESQLTVINVDGITKIVGSDFADTFYVRQTRAAGQIELDGGKGSDRYIFFVGAPHIDANVHDTGNPWDSGDTLEVRGTTGGDTVTVTNADITLSGTQSVDYVAPAADANVLQIKVFGKAGNDTLNVDSTALTVPVRIDGGTGHDLFTVGKNTLDNILGLARTGLNSPFGLGPVVLVGGAGQDSVVVTDEADLGTNTGNLTVFTETRLGVAGPVEVGVVSGLGMTLHGGVGVETTTEGDDTPPINEVQKIHVDDAISGTYKLSFGGVFTGDIAIGASAATLEAALEGLSSIGAGNVDVTLTVNGTHRVYTVTFQNGKGSQNVESILPDATNLITAGRVEFEGFENVDVRLGRGDDSFTVGGDAILEDLPQNRQTSVEEEFLNTLTGMTLVEGGGGSDTIGVIATNDLDRGSLLITPPGPLVSATTFTPGVDGSTSEVQKVTVSGAGRGVGFFTIQYRYAETRAIAFGASASEVQDALVALPLIGTNASGDPNVSVSKALVGGNDVYTLTFQNGLADLNLPQVVPLITPLAITGDTAGITTKVITSTAGNSTTFTDEVQKVTVRGVTDLTTFKLKFESAGTAQETAPLAYGASAATVQTALQGLSLIGAGNVSVVKATVDGADVYTVTFQGALAATDVAQIIASIVQDGADVLNVQSINEDTFFLGGGSDDTVHLNVNAITGEVIVGNGVNAKINLDGQDGSDTYDIHLVGDTTASLVNVVDTGSATNGFDVLTVTGTELPDLFLLRAAAAQSGLAFIALINHNAGALPADQPVERVNYDINLERITVNSLGGDDKFYIDDTRAAITINAGEGNDFFQIGQLYQTERTFGDPMNTTNIAEADAYATIETTKGFLSNGVSFAVTINSEAGEDLFIVFHNLAVANLNGGDDDDTFIVQAFALAGSTEDHRALTDISGDAGADFIQYAVNAPVNINGGDGFDTVIVIGTEFGDDFVVTAHGVFGAGLNVNFINVELLQLDGAEGDDRFFVLGTAPELVTEITGGLGTDLFSINGPTPANGVISNTLRGHSGILIHTSTSDDLGYDGLKVVGISAHVADNDEPAVIVTETDGGSLVVEGDLPTSGSVATRYSDGLLSRVVDSYTIVLSRPPVNGSQVVISIDPPPGLVFVKDDGIKLFEKRKGVNANGDNPGGDADGLTLTFTGSDWYIPQRIYFKVDSNIGEIPDLGDLNHKVVATDLGGHTVPDISGFATGGGGNGLPVLVTTTTAGDGSHNEVQQVEVAHTSGDFGYFALTFRDAETDPLAFGASAADVRDALVALPLIGKNAASLPNVAVVKSTVSGHDIYTITFQNDLANQDVKEIKARELSTLIDPSLPAALGPGGTEHGLASLPLDAKYEIKMFAGLSVPNVRVEIHTQAAPTLVVAQSEGTTSVAEISSSVVPGDLTTELTNRQVDQIDVRLSSEPTGTVTVALGNGGGQLQFFDADNLAGGAITSLTFDDTNYSDFRHILVRGNQDLIVEGFHKADLTLTASGGGYDGVSKLIVADIADDDYPGVRIIESNGTTDVIEFTGGDFGVLQATVDAAGLPYKDNYLVELTAAPTHAVTVDIVANPTRTSRTGGIRSFVEQLEVSTDGVTWGLTASLTFSENPVDANAWNKPQTVHVRALNDTRVDGTDTLVFAPTLDLLNNIQGPLMISGSPGDDHTGLTELEPIMLPGEINEKPSIADVVSAEEADGVDPATITINPSQISTAEIDALNSQPNASVLITAPLTDPDQLTNVSIQITHGPAKNKVRVITGGEDNGDGTWTLTLSHEWFSPFPEPGNASVPDNTSKYVLLQTNPNLLVIEAEQTDLMFVHDNDNVNSYNDPAATGPSPDLNAFGAGELFYDDQNKFGAKATVSTVVNGGPILGGGFADEVQKLTLVATAGAFKLVFDGIETADIPFNPSASQVQAALEALSNIGSGNVVVTKPSTDPVYMITFQGTLANLDQPKLLVDTAGLTGGSLLNDFRLTGLGMGGTGTTFSRTIGAGFNARLEPGGITFHSIEDTQIDLGPGANHFTISATQAGTKTVLNTGAGADLVEVKSVSGHTFVNLGAGADTINIHDDANRLQNLAGLLTVSGDIAQATAVKLAKGSPAASSGLVAAVNEIQQVTVDATGGTFKLSLTDAVSHVTATTGALAFNVSAAQMQTALGGLSTIGAGNVSVTKAGDVYRVAFQGAKAGTAMELLVVHDAGLTNGLGFNDTANIIDSGYASASVGVLTSSSLTGLSTQQVNEIQTIVVDATQGTFTVSLDGHLSAPLAFDISAGDLKTAFESLPTAPIKPGDVAVTKNDDVYTIRFQGNLDNLNVSQLVVTNVDLMKRVEPSGGDPNAGPNGTTATAGDPVLVAGSVAASTRVEGRDDLRINDSQVLKIDATGGTFTLTLLSGTPQEFTTLAMPFDVSAEAMRQTIQNAAAPAIAPGDTFEPQKFAVMVERYENVYIIGFQGKLRFFDEGPGVDLLKINTSGLTGGGATAAVTSRMDGINYYGVETLNIDTGSNNDIFNIQGTTAGSRGFYLGANGAVGGGDDGVAVTNVRFHNGNEQAFVSSNADLDFNTAPGFDFLTGNLGDVNGALNLDFGSGRHKLMISDEGTSVGDSLTGDGTPVVITDTVGNVPGGAASRGLPAVQTGAEIWITGLAGQPGTYPEGGISYKADTSGNFFDGIAYWTGSGNDTITIDGTVNRSGSGQRTMTLLNTGLGNDNVTVNLNGALNVGGSDTGQDGFFALNTMGGSFSPIPTTAVVTDNDTVNASGSTLPLVIFGGLGNDNITGGTNNDIIFGDDGRVQYFNPASPYTLLAVVGFGGRGDLISSLVLQPVWVFSRDLTLGGSDTVQGNSGEDILVGGAAGDTIDGNADDDLIFGDAVKLSRRPIDITNPRFETLSGPTIYAQPTNNAAGADNADGTARNYRDPNGTYAPSWALWRIHNLYHTLDIHNGVAGSLGNLLIAGGTNILNSFGNDYIAGGAASDEIFGQLGNDTIQGDGSIVSGANAFRDVNGNLVLTPSFEAATDGDDYIEGGGGNDTVFGGLGQDDIIGGSSDLFTLNTPTMRPDGSDLIFGGAGTHSDRNDAGHATVDPVTHAITTTPNGHARDADTIIGDNGDIFRLVGVNHIDGGGFLAFNYDLTNAFEDRGTLRLIPRATRLLDYTPGGPDFTPTVESAPADVAINPLTLVRDIGGADEVHGEGGDDSIYGMVGKDVLFGDGQDDVIIGGYGADWISGGTGDDGILGDDGRIFVSRNSTTLGEPLYGIAAIAAADANKLFATSNLSIDGVVNVTPTAFYSGLKYTVDLTPQNLDSTNQTNVLFRPLYANDIIYGGLGNDSIHGGAGDDAISGAEAPALSYTNNYDQNGVMNLMHVRSDFARPFNPGNPLGYNPATTKFDLYDANDPLRKVLLTPTGTLSKTGSGDDWILNFNETEGAIDTKWIIGQSTYPGAPTDGDDHIFGDLGNDWAVGGTGRDVMFGGWGDDLINLDDNLNTNGGLNDAIKKTPGTDTNPSYEDVAFGGAGRDVFLINTNGDRAMDWSGEFNSFYTPFAQYGSMAVSRFLQPGLPEYLYALSKSDGADQTLAAQYGSDPTRNGEPFGELGLVTSQDAAWQDQKGSSRDPQPGNTGGGQVDLSNGNATAGTKPIYQTAEGPEPDTAGTVGFLTDSQLAPIVAEAKLLWAQALGAGDSRLAALDNVQVEVGNLPQDKLGVTIGDQILIDSSAAGRGWFVDPTPADNQEFHQQGNSGQLAAPPSSPAFGRPDLLTVVEHELGHVLGLDDLNGNGHAGGLMDELLDTGVRRLVFGLDLPDAQVGTARNGSSDPLSVASALVRLQPVMMVAPDWQFKPVGNGQLPEAGNGLLRFEPLAQQIFKTGGATQLPGGNGSASFTDLFSRIDFSVGTGAAQTGSRLIDWNGTDDTDGSGNGSHTNPQFPEFRYAVAKGRA